MHFRDSWRRIHKNPILALQSVWCWDVGFFWDYIHFYSPSNAIKYVLLFALIHTMGHHCFFPRYQWYHSLLMNQNESYLHLPTLRLLFPIKFPMTIIQSSCQPHCSAKLALWFRGLYGLTTMQQHYSVLFPLYNVFQEKSYELPTLEGSYHLWWWLGDGLWLWPYHNTVMVFNGKIPMVPVKMFPTQLLQWDHDFPYAPIIFPWFPNDFLMISRI